MNCKPSPPPHRPRRDSLLAAVRAWRECTPPDILRCTRVEALTRDGTLWLTTTDYSALLTLCSLLGSGDEWTIVKAGFPWVRRVMPRFEATMGADEATPKRTDVDGKGAADAR